MQTEKSAAKLEATAAQPMKTPELKAIPKTNCGTGKNLLKVGYINTTGVTINPYFTQFQGRENHIPKLTAISPPKKVAT